MINISRYFFVICCVSVFAGAAFAEDPAPTPTPVPGDPVAANGTGTLALDANSQPIGAGYALVNGSAVDTNIATARYVKGAYNAAIKAVNTVASEKQDKLSSTNVTTTGSGAIVTSVTATQNTGGLSVTTGEVSIPRASYTPGSGRAGLWVQ